MVYNFISFTMQIYDFILTCKFILYYLTSFNFWPSSADFLLMPYNTISYYMYMLKLLIFTST